MIHEIKFQHIIVYVIDNYPQFFSGITSKSVNNLLLQLLSKAEISLFSSSGLLNKFGHQYQSTLLIRNACSTKFYREFLKIKDNANKMSRGRNKVTYGYIGSVAKWFDWDFIIKLALERSESLIKIIGPMYIKPGQLPKNVILEPAIDHADVAAAMVSFYYGLIPFKVNKLTESVDPVKYYEYVAAHIPVISTHFGEIKERITTGLAITLDQHLNGIEPEIESTVFWEGQFKLIDKGKISV